MCRTKSHRSMLCALRHTPRGSHNRRAPTALPAHGEMQPPQGPALRHPAQHPAPSSVPHGRQSQWPRRRGRPRPARKPGACVLPSALVGSPLAAQASRGTGEPWLSQQPRSAQQPQLLLLVAGLPRDESPDPNFFSSTKLPPEEEQRAGRARHGSGKRASVGTRPGDPNGALGGEEASSSLQHPRGVK